MAQSEAQRREMVRVDDILEISHRVLTSAEKDSLSEEITGTSTGAGLDTVSAILQSAGRTVDPESPTWRAISLLDRKLDMIISLLQKNEHASQETEYVRSGVNVSGSGIRFPSQQEYKKGDFLWIAMIFPSSPPMRVEAIAEIGRTGTSKNYLDRLPGSIIDVSSKFVAINAQDKEHILRYTFQRQRELLRAKRND
ncbi:MAG: hypothetical protein HOC91_03005 [Nitrospinaceae bacterium]|jgi:hypothetical protein|nr:hypothetical protein [Nitrospinaceae bacterium]MBT3821929.1 hypothetical protein [Nitrospinaceae bacterium]MBT4429463.1 hypothetical protein [Nitrospinaceae bacterium]MBT5946028.1 hypothetical protein [Nitrospinaceae bacterium]MBT6394521.1 hypothetical protein [Nitrospinaceae bacterium]